jgi:hypothetical protein
MRHVCELNCTILSLFTRLVAGTGSVGLATDLSAFVWIQPWLAACLHHHVQNNYKTMSDVGCDLAGTLRLNAISICYQDEECIQPHPDMHDAMPVFPENKNCTVTQTRTRREKKNTPQSSIFILQGIKSGGIIWLGHVACIREVNTWFWWEKLKGRKRPFRQQMCERKYIKMDLK